MIQLIASVVGQKQVLGKDGGLVWSHPDDLVRFKRLTMGGAVVMGRWHVGIASRKGQASCRTPKHRSYLATDHAP
jgi:hypothetical protein